MTEPTIDPAAIPPGGSQVPVSKAEEAASAATLQEREAEAVEAEMTERGALEAAAPAPGMLVLGAPPASTPALPPPPVAPSLPPCTDCGGRFGADGYCEQCGARQPNPRHHYEQSAPEPGDGSRAWVGGVCDRGIRHVSNEDALALHAEPASPRRAAIVVCDGVSTSRRSGRASQAAAEAALALLTSTRSRGLAGVASALVGALGSRLDAAADAANEAVLGVTLGPETPEDREDTGIVHLSDPACTFVAAVIDGTTAVVGSVGDSRGYWLPDEGPARLLTRDDSWSEEQIAVGISREVAEAAPQAHSITRWLGTDAPDHTPAKTTVDLDAPGWLMLCSDGLWNYASDPTAIRRVVDEIAPTLGGDPLPLALARRLAEWANAQGGRDNVTVALARIDGQGTQSSTDASTATEGTRAQPEDLSEGAR
ncbi:MAG: serine/threonine-protein phosphatase [Micrococcales bacterium]|nr:serine/threonine-protein phosphatase [Micrococcales bacterium]